MKTLLFAVALALSACATLPDSRGAMPVDGQPDTAKFKLYTMVGVPEMAAEEAARKEFDAYASREGYKSYKIVDKHWNYAPTYFEYTVRFSKVYAEWDTVPNGLSIR